MIDVKFDKMFKNENGEDVYFLSMKIDNDYQVVPMTKEQFDFLFVKLRAIYNNLPNENEGIN
jgi:hypothetical protein